MAALVVGVAPAAEGAVTFVAVDRAAAMGMYSVDKSWSSAVVDYDGDGDEDVWIGYHQWSGRLFSNTGGHYVQVATNAWPRVNPASKKVTDRHECAFADVNLDGRPDSYCSAGRNESNLVKNGMENEMWLQQPTLGQFTNVGVPWGMGDVCGRGRHVTFLNVNGDAYPDLFLGDAVPRNVSDSCDTSTSLPDEDSKIFINQEGAGFSELTDSGLTTLGVGQRCAERLDYDRDGWDDLVGCRFTNQPPRLFHNAHGRFVDVTNANGLTRNLADVTVADLDGDGWDDLVTASTSGFAYRLNRGGSFGPEVVIGTGGSGGEGRSVAVGDADGDGDLDVYGLMANPSGSSNPDDVLFLADHLTFSRLAVPPATGNGDEVRAIHPYGGGRSDFLVLNGADPAGPVQVIELQPSGATDTPPSAVLAAPSCSDLTCTFDGSGSSDPDGSVASENWSFSDGGSDTGPVVTHTFAVAGTYTAVLTVTDDLGATATASVSVQVGSAPPPTGAVAFRTAAVGSANGRSVTVSVPASARTDDVALLFVTANVSAVTLTAPAGWRLLRRVTDTSVVTSLWWRPLAADGPSGLTVSSSTTGILAAQLLVYSGVSTTVAPVSVGADEPVWQAPHTAPAAVTSAGSWVVWHWADKTGQNPTTGWAVPTSVRQRAVVVPTFAPRRVTAVSADSGPFVSAGTVSGPVARASAPTNTATRWSVVLQPAG